MSGVTDGIILGLILGGWYCLGYLHGRGIVLSKVLWELYRKNA